LNFLPEPQGHDSLRPTLPQLAEIHAAFAAAGIPPSSNIEAIKDIVLNHEWSRPGQAADQEEIFDDIALY
jgi:hypothetical protein